MSPPTLPSPGLGTFRLKGDTLKRVIHDALVLGLRHIDTPQMHDNEQDVGAAVDLRLSDDELEAIAGQARGERIADPGWQ